MTNQTKLSKIIIVYSLQRTGTHLTINTIVKNIYLNDSYLVYNLDKIDNFDVFIKENNYEFIIFKTHIYDNVMSLLKIVDKYEVNFVLPSTDFYRGCISYINYKSIFSDVSDSNKQIIAVDERYNKYIEYYKNYDYLINNSYNAIMIERENYDSNEKIIKMIHKLSKILNLKIKDKNNYIFPDDKQFIEANENELNTVQPLKRYNLKIFDSTIDYIKKLSGII